MEMILQTIILRKIAYHAKMVHLASQDPDTANHVQQAKNKLIQLVSIALLDNLVWQVKRRAISILQYLARDVKKDIIKIKPTKMVAKRAVALVLRVPDILLVQEVQMLIV